MRFESVLVTGAGGRLGRYVVDELRGRCEVTGLDLAPPAREIPFVQGDVTDLATVRAAAAGRDAILHIAAMANIWAGPPERIMAVNVMGTWNVLQAAEDAGVRRVVLCSSDAVIGFTVREGAMLPPLWLPVDEDHPRRPTDPYALSKTLAEEAGLSFARRGKLEVVVLRPVFVLYPEMAGEVAARAADPQGYRWPAAGGPNPPGGGPAWHYIDPRDAARGFRLALELADARCRTFFLCANETLTPEPTLERLRARLGGVLPEVRRPGLYEANPRAPLYDLTRAREVLGFEAEHGARHLPVRAPGAAAG